MKGLKYRRGQAKEIGNIWQQREVIRKKRNCIEATRTEEEVEK